MRYILVLVLMLLSANVIFAQCDAANRVQWQPKLEGGYDTDRRLEQRVRIEIMGRSANSALKILSEKTGVSLTVAPEDIYSTGERKLSIFAHGITLKSIMVRLPEALQECHWDIDTSEKKTSYLLHRNSDADAVADWLAKRNAAMEEEKRRAPLQARLEEARKGLAMSPAELDELEKTDLFLARSLRDPYARRMLQALFSLAPEQFAQFSDTGRVQIPYANASAEMKQIVSEVAKRFFQGKASGDYASPEKGIGGAILGKNGELRSEEDRPAYEALKNWQTHLPSATIVLNDSGMELGFGTWFSINFAGQNWHAGIRDMALYSKFPTPDEGEWQFMKLLLDTGAKDNDESLKLVHTWEAKGFQMRDEKTEQRRKAEWKEPDDPALLKNITLGDKKPADMAEFQQLVSRLTGLSVVSDYFTTRSFFIPDEARKALPVWQVLYQVCDREYRSPVYWKKAGDILIFHNGEWYRLAAGEIPEYLINEMRARLQKQGHFTLQDITEFALALEGKNIWGESIPRDLITAGMSTIPFNAWALKLYATLTPDQFKKASSSAGLTYEDMTIAQHRQVLDRLLQYNRMTAGTFPISPELVSKAVFHITTSTKTRRTTSFEITEMRLNYGDRPDVAIITLRLDNAPATPAKAK